MPSPAGDLGFPQEEIGIILVDHGSRRDESNLQLLRVVETFRQLAEWTIVEAAHMELAEPSIATAFGKCVAQGARLIVVFPYFLAPGRHWHQDIPNLASQAAASYPDVHHLVTAPLGLHALLMQVVDQRIHHCLQHAAGKVPNCDVCENTSGCQLRPPAS